MKSGKKAQLSYEETERAMPNQFSQSSVNAGAPEIPFDEEFNTVMKLFPYLYISSQCLVIVNSDMQSVRASS